MSATRRSFLQSALLLPSLFAVDAFARDNASTSFADFESGDYSDWTIEGDAFGTKPATDALFPGKVRGFGGRAYASTFNPRRGVLATGKAVSRDFVIEKPVITFRIGGGNHPGKACLNLVVDGKIERTETGDSSAQLLSRSWDVSALVGKTARLEIVDDTQSDRRGYVMVDDIAFGDQKPSGRLRAVNDRENELLLYFLDNIVDRRVTDTQSVFGISERLLSETADKICLRIIQSDMDHAPSRAVVALASTIKTAVLEIVDALPEKPNKALWQRMMVQGICDWIRTHVVYDMNATRVELKEEIKLRDDANYILSLPSPGVICAGFATLATALATSLQIKATNVVGYSRGAKNRVGKKTHHEWNHFVVDGGIVIPADTTNTVMNLNDARSLNGRIRNLFVLPVSPEEWAAYLSNRYVKDDRPRNKPLPQDPLTTLTFEQWKSVDTTALDDMTQRYSTWRRYGINL